MPTEVAAPEAIENGNPGSPETVEADPSWDGELTSISEASWYTALDPDKVEWLATLPSETQEKVKQALTQTRDGVTVGLQTKHENWDKGWRPKYEANAKQEKELKAWQDRLVSDEKRWWKTVRGEEDPTAAIKADLDAKVASFETEKKSLSEMLTKAHDEMKRLDGELTEAKATKATGDASSGDVAAVRKELETAQAEVLRLQGDVKTRDETEANALQAAANAAGDELFDWMEGEHAPIVANNEAFDYFNKLIAAETDIDDAVGAVYHKFPNLVSKKPEPVEAAVKLMHMGGTRPDAVTDGEMDYRVAKQRLREAAKS